MRVWMSLVLVVALAPALLAPVRLKDADASYMLGNPAISPGLGAYTLPAAQPLVTPTVIPVSPTILPDVSPTGVSATVLPGLAAPASATAPQVIVEKVYVPVRADAMSFKQAELCQRAMLLVQSLAMLSYQQKKTQSLFNLSLAAAAGTGVATAQKWPDMTAFNAAADNLPWFYPNKKEIREAIPFARSFCTH